ncbi:MAG: L,D-transpeptidase family protein [Croceibacterium sp.]
MKSLALAFALASSLALALPLAPAFASVETVEAIVTANDAAGDARRELRSTFGKSGLKNGEYVWQNGAANVTRVVVDLSAQMAYVYSGDELIGATTVSSGDAQHLSPIGIFTVIEKRKDGFSKKYDNAPMPFMQRIDDYGIALHAGKLPGRPASHGCVRLPREFAAKLFAATTVGTGVWIAEPNGHGTAASSIALNDSKDGAG